MSGIQFDLRTLLFSLTLLQIARAIALLHVWYTHRHYRPASEWALGSLLMALGFLLVGLRDMMPAWATVLLANALIIPGWMIFDFGIIRAADRQPPWRLGLLVTAAALVSIFWNGLLQPDYTRRLITFNLAILLFDGFTAYTCLKFAAPGKINTFRILATALILTMASGVWRTANGCILGLTSLLSPTLAQTQFSVVLIFFSIITTAMLVLLTSQKLQDEMHLLAQELIHQRETERDYAQVNAMTDSLTRLANRRQFDETLNTEFYRLKRSGAPLTLIMIDIDHFKKYNDIYGHQAGDDCLKQVAAAIRGLVGRAPDVVARYGGEEFAIILPETDGQGGMALAEHVRRAVAERAIAHSASPTAPVVTISLGLASVVTSALAEPANVVALADNALYVAKQGGRNRVEAAIDTTRPDRTTGQGQKSFIHLVWRPTYESGNPIIDAQHKSLFENSNALLSAIIEGSPKEECTALIETLLNDIVEHFQSEEPIFQAAGYPFADDHCRCHAQLVESAMLLAEKYGRDELTLGELFNFLAYDVVAQHMFLEDRKFFSFL